LGNEKDVEYSLFLSISCTSDRRSLYKCGINMQTCFDNYGEVAEIRLEEFEQKE